MRALTFAQAWPRVQTEDEPPLRCPLCGAHVRADPPEAGETGGAGKVGLLERHFLRECSAPGPMA